MKKKKNKFGGNKGFSMIEITICITIITIATGLIVKIFNNVYKDYMEIHRGSIITSYATNVLEKVDEKSYEEVKNSKFLENIKAEMGLNNENIYMNITTEELYKDLLLKINLKLYYEANGEKQEIKISKLKVKEIKVNE